MKNLKISQKLAVSFGCIILISVILVGLSISAQREVGGRANKMYEEPFITATDALKISKEIYTVQGYLFAATAEKDLGKYVDKINASAEKASTAIKTMQSKSKSQSAMTLENGSNKAVSLIGEAMGYMEEGNWEAAQRILLGDFQSVFEECSQAADAIYQEASNQAKDSNEYIANRTSSTTLFLLILLLVGILIAVVVVMILDKGLTGPISELEDVAEDISNGRLQTVINYESGDELGVLADRFRKTCEGLSAVVADISYLMDQMAAGDFDIRTRAEQSYVGDFAPILTSIRKMNKNLSSTLIQINDVSDQVASGSDQVSSGAQGLSQGATEQASAIEELAASINEISQQVKTTSENAKLASEQVDNAGADLTLSNQKMEEMIAAMSEISEKSGEIGKIIKTIEDIAFQTNILALNAAVEAARAGEAGKGFAVVADEVRNLAGKSSAAARETTVLLGQTVEFMEEGVGAAQKTADSMLEVVARADEMSSLISGIAEYTKQQEENTAEITHGIGQISSVVQNNVATAEAGAAASEELSGQAAMLKELVSRFRLKN